MKQVEDMDYLDQLLDNRWLIKRKSILKRDGCKCRMCGKKYNEEEPLHVHHRYYIYNALAWEYEDSALITLCPSCHSLVHKTCAPILYLLKNNSLLQMNYTPCV